MCYRMNDCLKFLHLLHVSGYCSLVVSIMYVIHIIFIVILLQATSATTQKENSFCPVPATGEDSPLIKTNSGVVLGRHIKSYNGRTVSAFEGIPYAEPPVGPLRFEKPEPVTKWKNILIANNTYICIQRLSAGDIIGTEDCLYLYIYVPRKVITGCENLNVVVGIHSGCFMRGDPHSLCGPGYLMDRDLIYVSINYRLSMLGFLSTEDDVVPGNNGLKDQVIALQWISDNIQYFGGNPKSVTLLGVSAGGASAHFHYLSPMSKDLFSRGISISGTALHPWVLIEEPAQYTKELAQSVNCPQEPSKLLVECLRKVDVRLLTAASAIYNAIYAVNLPISPFGPVIEKGSNAFLQDHPYKLLLDGKMKKAPWIASNTLNEGMFPVGAILAGGILKEVDEKWNYAVPLMLEARQTIDEEKKVDFAEKLRDFYIHNKSLSMDNINQLVDMFGDRNFKRDAEKAARLHAKTSKFPVYYYLFTYILEMRKNFSDKLYGAAHMDDARLIHPIANNPEILSEKDEKLKDILLDFVDGFASGKEPSLANTKWTPVEPEEKGLKYLHINGPDDIQMKTIEEVTPTNFWKSLPLKENEALFKEDL